MHIRTRDLLWPALLMVISPAFAQSPYAGQQHRPIKALSEQQVQGYLAGKGMGFAKAAELNHYPGPKHVLELAAPLKLSNAQRRATQALFDKMQAQAKVLGQKLVSGEQALEHLFASEQVDPARLQAQVDSNARVQGQLRYTHLVTHLAQRDILSPAQRLHYDQLRGYAAGGGHQHDGAHAH